MEVAVPYNADEEPSRDRIKPARKWYTAGYLGRVSPPSHNLCPMVRVLQSGYKFHSEKVLTKEHLDRIAQKIPKCTSMRTRPGLIEPDVYFRIMHSAQVGRNNVSVATYREQTIEISLEHKGVFKNNPVTNVTRRTPVERIVIAVPPPQGAPKPPKEPKPPRVAELLKKAIEWQALLDAGKIASQVEIASSEGITCGRVSQVLGMLRLAPEIQMRVLTLPASVRRTAITERLLRPITGITDHRDQIQEFYKLLKHAAIPLRPRSPEGSCRS